MNVKQLRPTDVQALIAAGERVQFLDVRQPEEYAICRIGDSPLIPLGELSARVGEMEVAEGALLVVYCHHGVRSLSGAAILQHAGLENVASLAGGIHAWSAQVDPAVRVY